MREYIYDLFGWLFRVNVKSRKLVEGIDFQSIEVFGLEVARLQENNELELVPEKFVKKRQSIESSLELLYERVPCPFGQRFNL